MPRPPANRAALHELKTATREVQRLKAAIGRNFYELGKVLARVRDRKLYEAGGHLTFDAYLRAEVSISRASAFKFIDIAETFSEKIARALGPEKLAAALRYVNLTPEDEAPGDVPDLLVPVVSKDGRRARKSIREATVSEVDAAARALRRTRGPRTPAAVAHAKATAELLARAQAAFARAHLADVKVALGPRYEDGLQRLVVHGVHVENAWQVFRLLAGVARAP